MFYFFLLFGCMLISSIGFIKPNKSNSSVQCVTFMMCWLIIFAVSSLRYNIGTDYVNYVSLYHDLNSGVSLDSNVEVGFYFIVRFCDYVNANVQLMFAIMAGITFLVFFARYEMRTLWGIFAFICIIYLPSFSLVRQMAAVAFISTATFYVMDGKIKKAYLFTALGCLFHLSALLFVPVIISKRFKITAGLGMLLVFIIFLLVFKFNLAQLILDNPIFRESKYGVYNEYDMFVKKTEIGTGLGVLLKLLPSFIFITISCIYHTSFRKVNTELNIVLNLNYVYILAVLLSTQIHIFNRLADLFIFVPLVTFLSLNKISLSRNNLITVRMMFIIVFLTNFTLTIIKNPAAAHSGLGIYPYQSILGI